MGGRVGPPRAANGNQEGAAKTGVMSRASGSSPLLAAAKLQSTQGADKR